MKTTFGPTFSEGTERRKCTFSGDVYRRAGTPEPVTNERSGRDDRRALYRAFLQWTSSPKNLAFYQIVQGLILDLRKEPRAKPRLRRRTT